MSIYCVDLEHTLEVDESVRRLGIFVVYTIAWRENRKNIYVSFFESEIQNLINYLRSRYTIENLKNDSIVRAYRDFFWRIGIDPTKIRPSSEALVRRALRGSFPSINEIVDAGNIASAYTMVPIGIYDLDKALPPFIIKLSSGGEVFRPIGGSEEILNRGIPILVDSRGSVMHIYPHRDSRDTAIDRDSKRIFILGAGVPKVPKDLVDEAVRRVANLLEKIGWNWCRNTIVKGFTEL